MQRRVLFKRPCGDEKEGFATFFLTLFAQQRGSTSVA